MQKIGKYINTDIAFIIVIILDLFLFLSIIYLIMEGNIHTIIESFVNNGVLPVRIMSLQGFIYI